MPDQPAAQRPKTFHVHVEPVDGAGQPVEGVSRLIEAWRMSCERCGWVAACQTQDFAEELAREHRCPDAPAAYTLQATRRDTLAPVYFVDHVYDGDVVHIHRTFEDAEAERGASFPMRVVRDGDEWWLEAVA